MTADPSPQGSLPRLRLPGRRRRAVASAAAMAIMLALGTGAGPAAGPESRRILGDRDFFTQGSFIAYAAPWSTDFGVGTALKHGVDFADEIAVRPTAFPADVEFTWHWPLVPPKDTGVYGYNAISYGSYDGGTPEVPITSRQVKAIATLAVTYRCALARPVGDFNVLCELFLTAKPAGEKVAEIGFFPRAAKSAVEFAAAGEQLGAFVDAGGREWKVARQPAPHGPFYMFMPATEVLAETLDLKAALAFLRARGCVTGEEWFNGVAFGIEPVCGSGSMKVERVAVDYR